MTDVGVARGPSRSDGFELEEDDYALREEGEDVDTDVESEGDPVQLMQEFGSHPLMERAQRALVAQLTAEYERLTEDLRQKEIDLKALTSERENVGVSLYNMQQQLAKLQISLEQAHEDHNALMEARLQEDDMINDIKTDNEKQEAITNDHRKQVLKHQSELNALQDTLRQVELYNQEMQTEIQVTRRATYKAEQSMQELEKNKLRQDLYIDMLNANLSKLKEQTAYYSKQIVAQRQETTDAEQVLSETAQELEMINSEKKQLMQEWKSSLVGLERRDEALAQATAQLREAETAVRDFDMELDAVKRRILEQQRQNETLVQMKDRVESEVQWVDEQLRKIRHDRTAMQERFLVLQQSLQKSEQEETKLSLAQKQLNQEMKNVLANIQVTTQHRQKVEEDIITSKTTKAGTQKTIRDLSRAQSEVMRKIHEAERQEAEAENNLARTRLDVLQMRNANASLAKRLEELHKEIDEAENTVDRYDSEIRQRDDEIGKKMHQIDRLNKKFNTLTAGQDGDENLGPLESTIKHMQKEIATLDDECTRIERSWLVEQTKLVSLTTDTEKHADVSTDLKARITVLSQLQLRLARNIEQAELDVKNTSANTTALRKDTDKLNDLIAKNAKERGELHQENIAFEIECTEELKELEQDSLRMQSDIKAAVTQKETLTQDILEAEKQVLYLEKKLLLDEETSRTLDPSVGQSEVAEMEKEIHRMTLRLDQLRKAQEKLVKQMEGAVLRRGDLALRARRTAETPSSDAPTKAALHSKISRLKKNNAKLTEESERYEWAIKEKEAEMTEVGDELARATASYEEAEDMANRLQGAIDDFLNQEQQIMSTVKTKKLLLSRLANILQTANHDDLERSALEIERQLHASGTLLEQFKNAVDDVQATHSGVELGVALKIVEDYSL